MQIYDLDNDKPASVVSEKLMTNTIGSIHVESGTTFVDVANAVSVGSIATQDVNISTGSVLNISGAQNYVIICGSNANGIQPIAVTVLGEVITMSGA